MSHILMNIEEEEERVKLNSAVNISSVEKQICKLDVIVHIV